MIHWCEFVTTSEFNDQSRDQSSDVEANSELLARSIRHTFCSSGGKHCATHAVVS